MAKRILCCYDAPEVELQFDGGESLTLRFDMRCIAKLREMGCLDELIEGSMTEADVCAEVICAGAESAGYEIEIERAKYLTMSMSVDVVADIFEEFTKSMGICSKEEKEALAKKVMAQFAAKKMWNTT